MQVLRKSTFIPLISLVGGVYKIVAKVLDNRLKMIVEKIISKPRMLSLEVGRF
jgi:hypothetical protein